MSNPRTSNPSMTGPVIMFISAVLFGYFGFFSVSSIVTNNAGQVVLMWAMLLWTLRIAAVVFAVAGVITFASPILGNLIYAIGSGLSAIGLASVGVMDVLDAQHAAAIPPVLAFLFAAWNGYGAYTGLTEVMAASQSQAMRDGAPW